MKIIEVKNFILKYKKRVIRATLFAEYLQVVRFQERVRKFKKETSLPMEMILLILEYGDGGSQIYL